MAEDFSEDMLSRVVAQICEMVGFSSVLSSPLFVLTDILKQMILLLGKRAKSYSELCGRTHVELSDLSCAFSDLKINPSELLDFFQSVGELPAPISVPKYPVMFRSDAVIAECVDIENENLEFSPIGSRFQTQNRAQDSSNNVDELNESTDLNCRYLQDNNGRHALPHNREMSSSNLIEELSESTDLNCRYLQDNNGRHALPHNREMSSSNRIEELNESTDFNKNLQENSGVASLPPNFTGERESLKVTLSIAGVKKAHKKKASKKHKKKDEKYKSKKKKKKKKSHKKNK